MSSTHLDLAGFVAAYPDFADTDPALVQSKLDDAAARTPAEVWGTSTSEGHGLLAAHLLSSSPWGRDARIKKDDSQTTYGKLRDDLEMVIGAAHAPRVTA